MFQAPAAVSKRTPVPALGSGSREGCRELPRAGTGRADRRAWRSQHACVSQAQIHVADTSVRPTCVEPSCCFLCEFRDTSEELKSRAR